MKMTLSSQTVTNERNSGNSASDNRSTSPNSSPRGSPKPSPRPQTKKDHSSRNSDSLSTSYKDASNFKLDISTTSIDGGAGASSPRSTHSANELSVPDFSRQDSANSSVKDQKVSRSSTTKKKSAWYSAFYPTYKSRSEEFKKTFKDMPDDERLVVDYSCAMQKEILVHGRLFISQNHLCFYANIFGWETNVTVRWRDVTAITKEKTALVIPNAILVSTRQEKHFLTSFVARDKTYLMLFRIWQNVLMDKPMSSKEMWHLVHQCYGEELGLTSDDEDYVAPSGGDDEKHSGRFSLESYSEECASNVDPTSATIERLLIEEKLDESLPLHLHTDGTVTSNGLVQSLTSPNLSELNLPTDMSDTSESDGEKAKTVHSLSPRSSHDNNYLVDSSTLNSYIAHQQSHNKRHKQQQQQHGKHKPAIPSPDKSPQPPPLPLPLSPYDDFNHAPDPSRSSSDEKLYPICTALHEGKQLMNEVVPMHVDQLFTLLFTPSKFFLDFHQQRRTADLSQTDWTYNAADGTKTRCVNLTAALNQTIGPKTAQVRETQTMLPCCKAGFLYAIDMETCNGGIPYADSFYIMVHFCLHKISENQSSIGVYAQIKYKKSVWGLVKGMIEKNCWQGLEDFYNSLAIALHAESEDSILTLEKRKVRVKQRTRNIQRICLERTPNRAPNSDSSQSNFPHFRIPNPSRRKRYYTAHRFIRIRLGAILKPTIPAQSTFNSDIATIIVFGVLILLVILNILLYYKLWSLEESPPYSIMDLHLLKNPPNNPDEWIKLLRQQEVLHSVEMQKWQQILKTAIKLLKQTEESLNELQKSIHPGYTSKLMSVIQAQKEGMPKQVEL